jgi:hypothetical protein
MNRLDHQLQHLLRAAAEAGPTAQDNAQLEPPFGLESRVLAAWREGTAPTTGPGWLPISFLLRACACACAVMLAAVGFNVGNFLEPQSTESQTYGELTMVDSVIQQSLEL